MGEKWNLKINNCLYHSCKTRLGLKNKEDASLVLRDTKLKINL